MKKYLLMLVLTRLVLEGTFTPSIIAQPLNDGLVLHLSFNEGSGFMVSDNSGNNNNGFIQDNPQWVTGQDGSALQFDGTNDYVTVPDAPSISNLSAVSVSVWIKVDAWLDAKGTDAMILSKGNWSSSREYRIEYEEDAAGGAGGLIWFISTNGSSTGPEAIIPVADISSGEWHHLAGTWDSATSQLMFYLDGQLKDTIAHSGSATFNGDAALGIGASGDNGASGGRDNFDGAIDEVSIFDRALTAQEILALFNGNSEPVNQAPIVSAGNDQTITLPTNSVILNGSVSDDGLPEGANLVIGWNLVDGPAEQVTFFDNTAPQTTASFGSAGTYLLRLSANDSEFIANDDVTVIVNQAPVAENQSVTTDEDTPIVITLTANDLDGDDLAFNIETPPNKGTLQQNNELITYTPNLNDNGSDSFTFSANDGWVDSNPATIDISINSVNDAPVASLIANPQNGVAPVNVSFSASTSNDVDGQIVSYFWDFGDSTTSTSIDIEHLYANPGTYQVTLTITDDQGANGVDNVTMQVNQEASITLLAPNGGENWQEGTNQNITWQAVNVTNANIDYSTSSTGSWIPVVQDIDASTGSYSWNVPNTPTTQARVRIFDSENTALSDNSDDVFAIMGTPTLTLTSPSGGENWIIGSSQSIIWNASLIDNIDIEYRTSPFDPWIPIVQNVSAGVGLYNWNVPSNPTTQATVRITDSQNPNLNDFNETFFSISETPTQPDGQVIHLNFNEGSGFSVSDDSGNNNNGTLQNGPQWIAGKEGEALQFDGSDDYVTVPDAPSISNLSAVSVSVWIKVDAWLDAKGTDAMILSKGNWSSSREYRIEYEEDAAGGAGGLIWFISTNGSGSGPEAIIPVADISSGEWHHLAGTWDSATSQLKFYLDGQLKDTIARSGSATFNGDAALGIGASGDNGASGGRDNFDGVIDEVSIFDRALTAQEILALYNGNSEPVNQAPIVSAGTDQTITLPTNSVVLNGSTSDDGLPQGSSLLISWSQVGGPTGQASFLDNTAPQTTATFTTFGDYVLRLSANDSEFFVSDDVSITVKQTNQIPVANNQSVTTDEDTPIVITLTANDLDGDDLAFNIETPPNKGTLQQNNELITYTPNLNVNGSDSFTFRANDGSANSNIATVDITVNPVNDDPVASLAANPQNGIAPLNVSFDATASGDVDGPIVSYFWNFGDSTTSTSLNVEHLYANPGTYTVTLTVTDDQGATDMANIEIQVLNEQPESPFTLIILPDTQRYAMNSSWANIYLSQTNWIKSQIIDRNIKFVLHEGDIVNSHNEQVQWDRANSAMSVLDGVVPYVLSMGNHDFALTSRNSDNFNNTFPLSRYENDPTFGGVFEVGKMDNTYHFLSAGGIEFLIITLEFGPRDETLAWANQLTTTHPNHKVIMVTHDYVYDDNTLHGSDPSHLYGPDYFNMDDANSGIQIWGKLMKNHQNVLMAFSGHVHIDDGAGRLIGIGDNGNRVYQMLANFQDYNNGGDGWLRIVTIDTEQQTIDVETYSPYLDQYLTDDAMDFTYTGVTDFGPPDTTPPTIPDNLSAQATSEFQINLTWNAAQDNETGIKHYNIYRDGSLIETSVQTNFEDTGLASNTTYDYQVSAVNNALLESELSDIATAKTLEDLNPPILLMAEALATTSVLVSFNEPLLQGQAEVIINYIFTPNANVLAANLQPDLQSVILMVSQLAEGDYTVTVNNIEDLAGNLIAANSQTNFTVVSADENLVLYLPFNENSGTTTADNSGNDNNGTLQNNPLWISGLEGSAVQFDGSDDYISVPDAPSISNMAALSVSLWIKVDAWLDEEDTDAMIISKGNWSNSREYRIEYEEDASGGSGGLIWFVSTNGSSAGPETIISVADISPGVWHHLAGTWDSATNELNFYLDGQLKDTAINSGNATFDGSAALGIGASGDNGTGGRDNFDGAIDELRIYNKALTLAEVTNLASIFNNQNVTILANALQKNLATENSFYLIVPKQYELKQNYPNPFNPETRILFQLPEATHVMVRIFNTLQQEVRRLVDKPYEAGSHTIRWDGKDNSGNSIASGIYLYHLKTKNFSKIRKMILIR